MKTSVQSPIGANINNSNNHSTPMSVPMPVIDAMIRHEPCISLIIFDFWSIMSHYLWVINYDSIFVDHFLFEISSISFISGWRITRNHFKFYFLAFLCQFNFLIRHGIVIRSSCRTNKPFYSWITTICNWLGRYKNLLKRKSELKFRNVPQKGEYMKHTVLYKALNLDRHMLPCCLRVHREFVFQTLKFKA